MTHQIDETPEAGKEANLNPQGSPAPETRSGPAADSNDGAEATQEKEMPQVSALTENAVSESRQENPQATEAQPTEESEPTLPTGREEKEPGGSAENLQRGEENEEEAWKKNTNFGEASNEDLIAFVKDAAANYQRRQLGKYVNIAKAEYMNRQKAAREAAEEAWKAGNPAEGEEFHYEYPAGQEELLFYYKEYKKNRDNFIESQRAEQDANLLRKNEILDEMKSLSEDPEREGAYDAFINLQQQYREIGSTPLEHRDKLRERSRFYADRFFDARNKQKELRELDHQKNLELKTNVVERLEQLAQEDATPENTRTVRQLQDEWQKLGKVPMERLKTVLDRYRQALDTFFEKLHASNAEHQRMREENLEAKRQIIAHLGDLVTVESQTPKAWTEAEAKINEFVAQFKALGPVPRKNSEEIWGQLNATLKQFYQGRSEFFKQRKKASAEIVRNKQHLIEEVKKLAEVGPRDGNKQRVLDLQQKWKTSGNLHNKQNEELWQEFREACDQFFGRIKEEQNSLHGDMLANLAKKKEIIAEIEALTAADTLDRDIIEVLRTSRTEFNAVGHVPFKEKDNIRDAYNAAVNRLVTKFKPEAAAGMSGSETAEMLSFQIGAQAMANDPKRISSEKFKLNKDIRKFEDEISTLENNMEFFRNSKNAGQFRESMEKQVSELKNRINNLRQKIRMLDNAGGAE